MSEEGEGRNGVERIHVSIRFCYPKQFRKLTNHKNYINMCRGSREIERGWWSIGVPEYCTNTIRIQGALSVSLYQFILQLGSFIALPCYVNDLWLQKNLTKLELYQYALGKGKFQNSNYQYFLL